MEIPHNSQKQSVCVCVCFTYSKTMADLCNEGPIQAMYKTLHLAAERTQTSPQSR